MNLVEAIAQIEDNRNFAIWATIQDGMFTPNSEAVIVTRPVSTDHLAVIEQGDMDYFANGVRVRVAMSGEFSSAEQLITYINNLR